EVVGEFVNLRRRGVNMIGLCPFHNEKTPSFTVSPNKNIFKCFGCGVAGDSVKFLMEQEGFSYPEALRYLAQKYNIEIEERELSPEERAAAQMKDSLFIVNQYAQEYYQEKLFDTDMGRSVGLQYFKERGFREDTIRKFGLGFATPDWDAFTKQATQAGYNEELLKKLGLTSQKGFDFFRDRVMFTIFNLSGKPVAFAGRILKKNVKAPKYVNSPETDIYHKSNILYGANFAQRSIRKQDRCIMVEGYTDVISLHQAGIENVVASSGTSLTVGQIRLVKRFSSNITMLFDGDAAGLKAAIRGLDLVLEQDMNVQVVALPDGEDPDSYLQKVGTTAFRDFLEKESKDFILFKTQLLIEETKGDPVKKAGLVKDIVQSIARIPDPIKRSLYIKETSSLLELDEQMLVESMNRELIEQVEQKKREQRIADRRAGRKVEEIVPGVQAAPSAPNSEVAPPELETARPSVSGDAFQEKDLIRVLMRFGGQSFDEEKKQTVADYILSYTEELLPEFEHALYQKVIELSLQALRKRKTLDSKFYLNHPEEEIRILAYDLIQDQYEMSPGWEEKEIYLTTQKDPDLNFVRDSISACMILKLRKVKKLQEKNQARLKEEKDQHKIIRILKVQQRLNEIERTLADETGTVVTWKGA
ncbi:MAG: DNA primase, partial [Bacteroidota bacterium]